MPLTDEQERIEAIGEQLRAKITSKFTASTFLAGFALAVLTEQIFALWQADSLPRLFPPAVGAVAGALLLFVTGVLRLDELTMPKRFWNESPKAQGPLPSRGGYLTDDDLWELQKRMIFFWTGLIIAATWATAAGVLVMLLPLPEQAASEARAPAFGWAVGGIAVAASYATWLRKRAAKKFNALVRAVD
jgi:hypothetical protein